MEPEHIFKFIGNNISIIIPIFIIFFVINIFITIRYFWKNNLLTLSPFKHLLHNETIRAKSEIIFPILSIFPIIFAYCFTPYNTILELIPIAIIFFTFAFLFPRIAKYYFFKQFKIFSHKELNKKLTLTPADIPSLKEFHSRYESKFIPDPNAPEKTQAQQNYEALLTKLENQSSEPILHTP